MGRGFGFERIREIDKEADDRENLEVEVKRGESLERRDEEDSSIESRVSDRCRNPRQTWTLYCGAYIGLILVL